MNLIWTINPDDIISQTLTGTGATPPLLSDRTQDITGLSVTDNTTWTLDVVHADGNTQCNHTLKFCNNFYYGRSADDNIDTGLEMEVLPNNPLTCNWKGTYTFAASGTAGRVYFCFPVKDGAISSWIDDGGYDVPFVKLTNISYTNSLGHIEDYNVYRTFNEVFGAVEYTIS